METAVSEINEWRDTVERLGIGALIILCIFALLWKSGAFLSPLISEMFKRMFGAMDSVTTLNTSVDALVKRFGDGINHTERQSAALEAAVDFAGEIAIRGTLPEERAREHVEKIKDRLRG